MLYDGDVIAKGTNVISIPDSEETLILAEEILNQLSMDFSKRVIPHTELSAEQAFCSLKSLTSSDTSSSCRPTKVEVPNELPKVSLFVSIKKSLVDSSVAQLYLKSVENVDFQVQIQEKILEIEILENELKRIKGKHVVDSVAQKPKVITITQGMENANVLREIVEEVRASNPLDGKLDLACKYAERIQEELVYVHDTCPCLDTPKERLIAFNHKNKDSKVKLADPVISLQNREKIAIVTPKYKQKKVSFAEPIASSSNNHKQTYSKEISLVRNACPLTRITTTKEMPLRKSNPLAVNEQTHVVVQIVLWYLDSGCSKHMIGDRSQLINFVAKFLSTVKFGNDQIAKIMGYDLEVEFHKHTCFVRNLEGVNLLSGSRGTNLYTISLGDMLSSSPICLLLNASKTKSWLWHRRLSHLNFGAINHLARHGLVRGLPKLKFEKDHLCSACAMGKSKKHSHKPKADDTNQE
ncbi:retrovirus-related pol polyprotein from transposon TNT 1-94 [Tanacetum coccineum]